MIKRSDTPQSACIACFITSHGFGHAARAAAVMQAISGQVPGSRFEIFSRIPEWFFTDFLPIDCACHSVVTDIGMVQQSPLVSDIPATIQALQGVMPYADDLVDDLSRSIRNKGCQLVICDIAPLGIAVAEAASLPSVLIENFTWDWIYEGYLSAHPELQQAITYYRGLYQSAAMHIQAEPVCRRDDALHQVHPVSREALTPAAEVRRRLGVPAGAKMVLVTMGGVPDNFSFNRTLHRRPDVTFVISGGGPSVVKQDNVVVLPQRSGFFHPDLINAADIVVGKAGYSTVAEVHRAGKSFVYVARTDSRESKALVDFIDRRIGGVAIPAEAFYNADWMHHLDALVEQQPKQPDVPNGARQIAQMVCSGFNLGSR